MIPCAIPWCTALTTKVMGFCTVHEKHEGLHPALTQRQAYQKIVFQQVGQIQQVGRENDDASTTRRKK